VPNEDASPEAPALSYVQELGKGYREATDKLRARADIAAKSLGALASTVLAAVGIAKFADVMPFPFDAGWWSWLALFALIIGFVGMATVVAGLTRALARLDRPLFMSTDPRKIDKLETRDERRRVRTIFREVAALNGVASLRAYEARAHRLERIADRSDHETAKRLRSRAALIAAEVMATQNRARLVVVRNRTSKLFGRRFALGLAFFLISLIAFGISADYLAAKRTDEVTLAKSCAEAEGAGASTLPSACNDFVESDGTDEIALAQSCGEARKAGATTLPTVCSQYLPSGGSGGQAEEEGNGEDSDSAAAPAKGTVERVQAMTEAIRAAASLASTLGALEGAVPVTPGDGKELLQDFLREVGFPLAQQNLSRLTDTLWDRFAGPDPPPLPPVLGQPRQRPQPITLTVHLRDHRSPVKIVQTLAPQPPFMSWIGPAPRFQTIRLTVVVRDRQPRTQIIRVPVAPED
jgi:hypothetical protein